MRRSLAIGMLPLLTIGLAACGANSATPNSTRPTATTPPPISTPSQPPPQRPKPTPAPATGGFQPPRIMNVPGLESVIGQDTRGLQRQFGAPRLNVREGDARKLQFTGEACVLDIYLYPLTPGAEPTATYVDARRASDGLDVDRAACVSALKR